jgi:hypothetical protein
MKSAAESTIYRMTSLGIENLLPGTIVWGGSNTFTGESGLGKIHGTITRFEGDLPSRLSFRYANLPAVVRVVSYVYGTNGTFPPRQIIESVVENNQPERVLGTNLISELVLGDAGISADGYVPTAFRTKNLDRPVRLLMSSNNILHEILADGRMIPIEELVPDPSKLNPKLPLARHLMWALIVLCLCSFPLLLAAKRKKRNQVAAYKPQP